MFRPLVLRSIVATLLCMIAATTVAQEQQLVEVRFYHFRSAESAASFDEMVEKAAMPLLKSHEVGPVGVFHVSESPTLDENARVTVVPYQSMEKLLKVRKQMMTDATFLSNAESYLDQESGDPAYERVESMLLHSFTGQPDVKIPGTGEDKERLFELRTYKSENEVQQALKVQMFNEGEIDVFKKTGLDAVFYGDALFASDLPQLTYMLVHEDKAAQDKSWQTFINSPEWKALSGEAKYKIIKLQIKKHMLKPTSYSQIR